MGEKSDMGNSDGRISELLGNAIEKGGAILVDHAGGAVLALLISCVGFNDWASGSFRANPLAFALLCAGFFLMGYWVSSRHYRQVFEKETAPLRTENAALGDRLRKLQADGDWAYDDPEGSQKLLDELWALGSDDEADKFIREKTSGKNVSENDRYGAAFMRLIRYGCITDINIHKGQNGGWYVYRLGNKKRLLSTRAYPALSERLRLDQRAEMRRIASQEASATADENDAQIRAILGHHMGL